MSDAGAASALGRLERQAFVTAGVFLLATAVGGTLERRQFLGSWLLALVFWLGVAVGSLGLAMLNQLTGGAWGLVPRRFHEAAARTIPLLGAAFLPLLVGVKTLYPWAAAEAVSDPLVASKAAYLNVPFFAARAVVYFGVWSALAYLLSRGSRLQDDSPDPVRAARLRGLSAAGLVLLSLTTTFAAVDWGMSLAPHWFSTIYGVLYIVAWTLTALAFTIVLLAFLAGREPFDRALRPGVVHDLGKLLLTFTMLWGYVNFSQYLIVWSGNISEETPFYVRRLQGGWQPIAIALLLFHFALPFALLLSRPLKRSSRALAAVAALMLLMQLLDFYWLLGPDLASPVAHGEASTGAPAHGLPTPPLHLHWLDLTAVVGLGALWLAYFARQARGRPLLPMGEQDVRALLAARAEAH